jgi:hypothetical protein
LRDGTFRPELELEYQPRRVLPTAIFIPGILVAISRVYPSRNIRLRDETFRPPFRKYYRPKFLYLNVTPFVGTLEEVLFKGMERAKMRKMR